MASSVSTPMIRSQLSVSSSSSVRFRTFFRPLLSRVPFTRDMAVQRFRSSAVQEPRSLILRKDSTRSEVLVWPRRRCSGFHAPFRRR